MNKQIFDNMVCPVQEVSRNLLQLRSSIAMAQETRTCNTEGVEYGAECSYTAISSLTWMWNRDLPKTVLLKTLPFEVIMSDIMVKKSSICIIMANLKVNVNVYGRHATVLLTLQWMHLKEIFVALQRCPKLLLCDWGRNFHNSHLRMWTSNVGIVVDFCLQNRNPLPFAKLLAENSLNVALRRFLVQH